MLDLLCADAQEELLEPSPPSPPVCTDSRRVERVARGCWFGESAGGRFENLKWNQSRAFSDAVSHRTGTGPHACVGQP